MWSRWRRAVRVAAGRRKVSVGVAGPCATLGTKRAEERAPLRAHVPVALAKGARTRERERERAANLRGHLEDCRAASASIVTAASVGMVSSPQISVMASADKALVFINTPSTRSWRQNPLAMLGCGHKIKIPGGSRESGVVGMVSSIQAHESDAAGDVRFAAGACSAAAGRPQGGAGHRCAAVSGCVISLTRGGGVFSLIRSSRHCRAASPSAGRPGVSPVAFASLTSRSHSGHGPQPMGWPETTGALANLELRTAHALRAAHRPRRSHSTSAGRSPRLAAAPTAQKSRPQPVCWPQPMHGHSPYGAHSPRAAAWPQPVGWPQDMSGRSPCGAHSPQAAASSQPIDWSQPMGGRSPCGRCPRSIG